MKLLFILLALFVQSSVNAQTDPELFPLADRKSGYIGYYLEDRTNVVKPQFCSASYNVDGYYLVSKGEHEYYDNGTRNEEHIPNTEKFALLNSKGQFVINFSDNYTSIGIQSGLIEVEKNNFYGVVNDKNEIVIPLEYQELDIKNQEVIIARKNNRTGVITKDNIIIIPFIYDEIFSYTEISTNNFYLIVSKDGKKGVIDKNNKFIIPLGEHDLEFITEKSICLKKNEKFSLVTYDFKIILPNSFEVMTLQGVRKNEQEIYTKKNGKNYNFTIEGKLIK
ncbi:WG repeat-containing protein [Pinibacter soli]|uniref:WG repeat-containing protein n=1 Tax=Pinibacter soli TaxID=3044211 RepID=A0ABT6RG75_9BACT|nr:WG repeat-containing protein [Pinibacter soli]MDI3321426.1 WG repeat-containing protein [Pinibacter soli]